MKPRIGIFGLSGCWGEQIVILNCEDELLDVVGGVEIVDFLGGSSDNDETGPLDIAFVEGSVGSARDEEQLGRIRERARLVVACGSCACSGGLAAVGGAPSRDELGRSVYGPAAARYDIRAHRPLSDVVPIDFAIAGCPMEKRDFLRALGCLLNGDRPELPRYPVCHECKMRELDCLLVSRGLPCAGSVTAGGCDARCPSFGVPCIGCRGPADETNFPALREILERHGHSAEAIGRSLHTFAVPILEREEGASQ